MSSAQSVVEVEISACPPSLNQIASKGTRWLWTQAKKEWTGILVPALAKAGMQKATSVYVEGHVTFPNRQKRDQGNFRAPLEKFLGDALQAGLWLPDDDWDHFQFGDLSKSYEKGVARTRLILFCQ